MVSSVLAAVSASVHRYLPRIATQDRLMASPWHSQFAVRIGRTTFAPGSFGGIVGVYWRAHPDKIGIMEGRDDQKRVALIAERLAQWTSVRNA